MQHRVDNPPRSLNAALDGFGVSPTLRINECVARLREEGREVLSFGLGQSPFSPPPRVVQGLRDHAAVTDYLPVAGLPALREAVAAHHARRLGLECTADDVLIGPGSKELLFLAQLVHDGELMIPSPCWVSYAPQARLVSREVRWLPTHRADGWRLDPDVLDEACREEPGLARILILNYPNNPTGVSFADDALRKLAKVARRHGLIVLADEIYGELAHDGDYVSIARHYPEGTIVSSGLSKWCGAGGWRLGTFLFPENLAWLREAMACAASETYTSVSAPVQYAAIAAFEGGEDIEAYLRHSREILRTIGRHVAARLRETGAHLADPEGGFYLFPDFSPLRAALAARGIETSVELAERALEETGVAFLPGSAFGRPPAELTVRLAFVNFDGDRALEIARACAARGTTLELEHLAEVCAETIEAADRLARWLRRD